MRWRSIGVVLMFNGEAVFSARRGASNQDEPPRMDAEEFLELLGDEPPSLEMPEDEKVH